MIKMKDKFTKMKLAVSRNLQINKFKSSWVDLMVNLGALNLNKESFGLNYVEITEFGYRATVCIPIGFEYEDFLNHKEKIETGLNCRMISNPHSAIGTDMSENNLIDVDFISTIDMGRKYNTVKTTKPTQVYVGDDYVGNPIIIDFAKLPNLLVVGASRCGKTKMIQLALSNLSRNFSIDEVQFYLFQVDRSDLILLEDNKNTKAFVCQDYDQMLEMLLELREIVIARDLLIRPYTKNGTASNYMDYNNLSGKEPFPAIFIAVDEMASIQEKGDNATKDVRESIMRQFRYIGSKGASCGVFLMLSLQRPDANSLDTSLKSNCSTIVSFRANNSKSSEVATDDAKIALGLRPREFVYRDDSIWQYGIVPFIDTKDLLK